MKQSFASLQVGRGLAAISVVLYHAEITLQQPKYWGRPIVEAFSAGDSGVHFFFVLSGFVIFLTHRSDLGQRKTQAFLWKRFRRLYPPLWVVLCGLVPVYFLVPSFVTGTQTTFSTIASAFLISPSASDPILAPEWTLRHEVLFYAFFALAIWRPRIGFPIASIWLALSAICMFFRMDFPLSFLFSQYHLLFALGIASAICFQGLGKMQAAASLLVGAALFAATWSAVVAGFWTKGPFADLSYGLGAMLITTGAAGLENRTAFRTPDSLKFLGDASYSIYLVHWPVISVAAKLLLWFKDKVPDVFLLSAAILLGIGAGIGFHDLVEKPLLRLTPRRIGASKIEANA